VKTASVLSVSILAFLLVSSCEKKDPLAPELKPTETSVASDVEIPELIARELVALSNWPVDENADMQGSSINALEKQTYTRITNFQRIPITGQIVHYKFQVVIGPGQYDVIGVHRVIKERRPFWPERSLKAFFYQHGDYKDFEGMCLPGTKSPSTPDDFGIAVFLAENNVDVWGIDQAWTLVPESVADHSFMANWGIEKQAHDLSMAIAIARFTRFFTGNRFTKLFLCGYSSGVATGYTLLNQETQLSKWLRQVDGYIAADLTIKTDHEGNKQVFVAEYNRLKQMIDTVNTEIGYLLPR